MEDITKIKLNPEKTEPPVEEPEKPQVEEPVETPIEEPATPPAEPQPVDHDAILRERLGMSVEEIETLKQEYESMKGKPFVDDPELVPDDEFLKNFIKVYKRGGSAAEYLEAMTTDFSKMSAEDIVKYEMRKANPGLPEKFINRKVKDFLQKEFNFQEEYDDEEDKVYAEELLRMYADRKRAEFEESKKKFQIPERKQPNDDVQAEVQAEVDRFNSYVKENPVTKSIMESKKVAFGDFNYQVDPESLVTSATDSAQFFSKFSKKDGGIDLEKFFKVDAIASDPDQFLKAYAAHEIAKAKIEWLKELKNPSSDPVTKPPTGEVKVRLVQ